MANLRNTRAAAIATIPLLAGAAAPASATDFTHQSAIKATFSLYSTVSGVIIG